MRVDGRPGVHVWRVLIRPPPTQTDRCPSAVCGSARGKHPHPYILSRYCPRLEPQHATVVDWAGGGRSFAAVATVKCRDGFTPSVPVASFDANFPSNASIQLRCGHGGPNGQGQWAAVTAGDPLVGYGRGCIASVVPGNGWQWVVPVPCAGVSFCLLRWLVASLGCIYWLVAFVGLRRILWSWYLFVSSSVCSLAQVFMCFWL